MTCGRLELYGASAHPEERSCVCVSCWHGEPAWRRRISRRTPTRCAVRWRWSTFSASPPGWTRSCTARPRSSGRCAVRSSTLDPPHRGSPPPPALPERAGGRQARAHGDRDRTGRRVARRRGAHPPRAAGRLAGSPLRRRPGRGGHGAPGRTPPAQGGRGPPHRGEQDARRGGAGGRRAGRHRRLARRPARADRRCGRGGRRRRRARRPRPGSADRGRRARDAGRRWFLDLAHPRNFHPDLATLPGVRVMDLEHVFAGVEAAREARAAQTSARRGHRGGGCGRLHEVVALPRVRRGAARRARAGARAGAGGSRTHGPRAHRGEREDLHKLARSLARAVLHHPTLALREADASREEGRHLLETATSLFGVDPTCLGPAERP